MDVADALMREPQVLAYFGVLGWAAHGSVSKCRPHRAALALAVATVAVTWFFILRYTVEYMRAGGEAVFDDAYVSRPVLCHLAEEACVLLQ